MDLCYDERIDLIAVADEAKESIEINGPKNITKLFTYKNLLRL